MAGIIFAALAVCFPDLVERERDREMSFEKKFELRSSEFAARFGSPVYPTLCLLLRTCYVVTVSSRLDLRVQCKTLFTFWC